jgi:ABC-2 type transport system ATP-binding protein
MGAGARVGRVGGLAVALGVGAAVFTGHGIASAETSDGPDSASTSSSSSASSSSTGSDSSAGDKTSKPETHNTPTHKRVEDEQLSDRPTTRKKKRSNDEEPASGLAEAATESTRRTVHPEQKVEEARVEEQTAPTANVKTRPITKTDAVVAQTAVEQAAARPDSHVGSAAEPEPQAPPVDSPAQWALLAAARRDFGTERTRDTGVGQATSNSLITADAEPTLAESAASVVAVDAPPLFGWVQQVPIIGPQLVTPVVGFVKQIPLVGDVLHPIIGYPLGYTGGTTPRDVRVISFDGTPIYVHFFPAQGAAIGTDPQRSGLGASRRDESARRRRPVPAERHRRDGAAATQRLQRRDMGSTR